MGSQQYSLRWNNYLRHITCAFGSLRTDKDLVDVTLSCDGHKVQAHKMLLSACSSYFKELFKENPCQHPVIIFRNVPFEDLLALIDFMYQGEVNVEQEQLASFLNTAELLQVKGLTNSGGNTEENQSTREVGEVSPPGRNHSPAFDSSPAASSMQANSGPPSAKRRKWRAHSLSPVSMTPVIPGNDGLSDQNRRGSSPPVVILPMKIEAPDYIEDEGVSEEDTADETLARLRENDELLLTKSSDVKLEQAYNVDSNPVDILSASLETDHHLPTAGPSNDGGQLQESSQGKKRKSSHKVTSKFIERAEIGGYSCRLCGRNFNHRDSCQKHMAMHLGTSKCYVCSCVLSRKSHMKRHLKHVHGIDDD